VSDPRVQYPLLNNRVLLFWNPGENDQKHSVDQQSSLTADGVS